MVIWDAMRGTEMTDANTKFTLPNCIWLAHAFIVDAADNGRTDNAQPNNGKQWI